MNAKSPEPKILDGYRLIRFLGRGAFGEVWLCRSETMGDYRAIKLISTLNPELLEKEYNSLLHYRKAAALLRSPYLIPIEHINRDDAGLYYVMPLADGVNPGEPADLTWRPLSLSEKILAQTTEPEWFSCKGIIAMVLPILQGLQTLSDAGLVHRDVKPENILFFNGEPCLADISLLGADGLVVTRRGTPGYATPTWYNGGHPDMYGVAATLYTLLTGNSPDKMGRSVFIWPPQGESSLSESERTERKRLHAVISRATDENISQRFVNFASMAENLSQKVASKKKLPNVFLSVLTVTGVAVATLVAAYRNKHAELESQSKVAHPIKSAVPELTEEQKNDYRALAGLVQGYLTDGKYDNALAAVEMLLSKYPQARTQPSYSIARAMALKGLGRIDEAKQELLKDVHLATAIDPMVMRKGLWEDLGDLEAAEKDLTRIIDRFGPNIFPLSLRADVRAQRGNFAGVFSDQKVARAIKPDDAEHQDLVKLTWAPFERKYPGYADYLKSQPQK